MKQIIFWTALFSLIIFRYFSTRPVYQNGDLVRITAVVFSDPISYPGSQSLKAGGLKISLPLFPEIYYGDLITVTGITENGKLTNPRLLSDKKEQGFGSELRNKTIAFYQENLPEPMSGLTAGVVLGSKGTITADFWNKVKLAGVAHVVVASGTNVTFVVSFLMAVLTYFLPRRKAIFGCLIGIILYLFISGFDAPLVRAAVMTFLTFWAVESGRLINGWRILFLTVGIMLAIEPDWIVDIGFILSFVSTASIMLFDKKIGSYLKRIPEVLREGLSTSLSAQIGVAPILFVTFGQFNILSPVINALVLWTVPYIMILGAAGGAVGLIIPVLGKLILWLSYPLSWWFVRIVTLFS